MATEDLVRAFWLAGHHALVTGGGSGLGLAIARCFVAAGARVTIAGTRQAKLDAALDGLGPGAGAMAFDVTRTDRAEAFAAAVAERRGPVSVLVNNAGNTVKKPLADMEVDDFRAVMDVHVTGAYALTRAFLPQILAAEAGSILFTASMASYLALPNIAGYTTAKTAILGLVRAFSAEVAGRGVRVNGVAPGWIDTDLFRQATATDPARRERILARIPAGRLGTPEEVGWAMAYLASPAAAYVNAQVLAVDGGALSAF
ncbi:SDR family NAD(P)-dependent oxidoreductase [Prosthecomicrobium sp. N25]|uniref:SDR family NAD(P)-dependent oxidoreductase n=1 Tax=Prosthecomicrobium sp. N25 TaxID=3129254 RepID=UPI003077CB25